MRDNHLSFAKVLQKKKQASVKQLKLSTLRSLLEQYEEESDKDYTIYLGKKDWEDCGAQTRQAKQKGLDGNGEMFDCWLEKQSATASNKENHSFQQQINSKRQKHSYTQYAGSSPKQKDNKLRNTPYLPKQQRNTSLKSFNRSYKGVDEQKQSKNNLEIENQPTNNELLPNFGDRKSNDQQRNTQTAPETSQNEGLRVNYQQQLQNGREQRNSNKFQELIAGTETIHKQIAELARSLINQNYNLLQEKSNQQSPTNLPQTEQTKNKMTHGNQLNSKNSSDPHTKRFQQAKHELQGYLDKFMKNKSKQPQQQSIKVQPKSCNIIVGFSFSPEINFINQQSSHNELHINHIYEAKSELPSEIINDTKFNELKKNFPSLSTVKIENDNIINIQSVHYNNDSITPQNRISDNVPQTSKETKLMPIAQKVDSQKQVKRGEFMEIEEIFQMKKIVKKDEHCQNKLKSEPFSTKVHHQQKPPNQKLSLISHNKSKQNTIKTNKASPKLKLLNSKQPKTQITQFASLQSPKQEEQKNISSSNEAGKGTIKTIREVKYSIINPNVLHPSNVNLIHEQNKAENKKNNKILEIHDSYKNSNLSIRFNYQNREKSSVQSLFHKKEEKQKVSLIFQQKRQKMDKKDQQNQKFKSNEITNNSKPSNYTQSSESSQFIFDI